MSRSPKIARESTIFSKIFNTRGPCEGLEGICEGLEGLCEELEGSCEGLDFNTTGKIDLT